MKEKSYNIQFNTKYRYKGGQNDLEGSFITIDTYVSDNGKTKLKFLISIPEKESFAVDNLNELHYLGHRIQKFLKKHNASLHNFFTTEEQFDIIECTHIDL